MPAPMTETARAFRLRREVIATARAMNASGLNQGVSGNVSARLGDRALVTPSATPYDAMRPDMIASLPVTAPGDPAYGVWEGPLKPTTEWRFHVDVYAARPDAAAIVHVHAPHATAVALTGAEVPPVHYMIAAHGGATVRCAPYAPFGTAELSRLAVAALEGRHACLLANHGLIALGGSLAQALWRAEELEALCRQWILAAGAGDPVSLGAEDIDVALAAFAGYGRQA